MTSYEILQIQRVRNGYIVGPASNRAVDKLGADDLRVYEDFDDMCAYLEMQLGDPAQEQAAQAEQDAARLKEGTAEEFDDGEE